MIPHPPKPAWIGPYVPEGGLTHTKLLRWIENPFSCYLYAYCGLKPAAPPEENLSWGSIMHVGLEHLIREAIGSELPVALHKAFEEMYKCMTEDYPGVPQHYFYTCVEMLKLYPIQDLLRFLETAPICFAACPLLTEYEFKCPLVLPSSRELWCRGKVDVTILNAFQDDHKCKGRIYPMETAEEIWEDTQMNFYQRFTNAQSWQYDLIGVPYSRWSCPSPQLGETPDGYAHRLFHKHFNDKAGFPIAQNKPLWICCIPHFQSTAQNEWFFTRTLFPLIEGFCTFWDYVTSPGFDPNNPACYNTLFYQAPIRVFLSNRTDKYKDSYHGVLTGRESYDDLIPVENFYPELTKDETTPNTSQGT